MGRPAEAFPDQEKAALADLISSQATSFLLEDDQFFYLAFGDTISRVDTQTWELASEQIPDLVDNSSDGGNDLTGDVAGLAIRGNSLFISQTDGDLLTVDLDTITDEPSTVQIIDGTLGGIVADNESSASDDQLYLLDKTNNALIVYDIGGETITSISLLNGTSTVAPVAAVFVPFPTDSSSSTTDKIFVTTNSGILFVINEGASSVSGIITLFDTTKEMPAAAVTPGGDFLLVVNADDTAVHVIATATNLEVDTDAGTGGTNPIALPDNGNLEGIVVTEVANPDDVYAYVSGSSGISVIDLNIATGSVFNEPTLIDFNDEGGGDDEHDPLEIISPGPVVVSSLSDGYVYTSNGNATVSVITENPFVTIGSTSLGEDPLTVGGSFTVTFQSDETGTYSVRVGGDQTANGTEVTSGPVDTADSDVTTAAISYDSSIFGEGTNRVFVFVTDTDGNLGRDAVDITVDTPPPGVEILGTNFGNEKIYVTFTRLTASDMDHYNVYVDADPSVIATKTEAAGTLAQPSSGDTIEAKVVNLTNGVTYYIGIEGVDQSGNVGPRTTTLSDGTPASATAEDTFGLAEATGETGCALLSDRSAQSSPGCLLVLVAGIILFCGARLLIKPGAFSRAVFVSLFLLSASSLNAKERTPQWWSLEMKGGAWMPLDQTTKNFFGNCCEPTGMVEFGFLYKSKLGVEVGVGYTGAGGKAIGGISGAVSGDGFDFTMIPIQNSVTFRADFKEDQLFVPYVKAGLDYVIFRENVQGDVTSGVKLGLHTTGGVQILLDKIEDLTENLELSMGVNDVYFVVEGRYGWINGFGGTGVDLSNLTFSGGFLFEF